MNCELCYDRKLVEKIIHRYICVLWTDDVTIMTSSSKKFCRMFKIKFPTKRIFWIFPILRINGMAPFCNLFMERPSYVKIQRKIFLEDDLAMIFIDFGLLRSKISYSLAEEHWSHTNLGIWQPTYDSVCKDNSWIHGKCLQRFLSYVYKRFFLLFSSRFFTFFNVIFIFIPTFITSMFLVNRLT